MWLLSAPRVYEHARNGTVGISVGGHRNDGFVFTVAGKISVRYIGDAKPKIFCIAAPVNDEFPIVKGYLSRPCDGL